MNKTPYQRAVEEAEAFLAKGPKHYVELQKSFSVAQMAVENAETFRRAESDRVGWTGRGVESLIFKAGNDPVAYDALKHIACELLRHGDPIPEPLASFVVEVLQEKRKRPNQSGRYEGANAQRDHMIALAVFKATELGLSETRNDATPGEISACDAVAEALKNLGQTPSSYKRVKEIWQDFKNRPSAPA
jgi:hypothetical protein